MTVQKDVTKNIYVGNGSTRTFPFTFECPAEHPEYIKVYLIQDDGTALATSDYQLDMDARQITYPSSGTALPEGKKLVIMRELPLQQMMNLVNNGPYFAEDVETAFDENVMAMQQIAEKLNRSIIMSVDIDGDAFVNEVPFEAGKSFRIADDGKSIVLTEDPARVLLLAQEAYAQTQAQAQIASASAAAAAKSEDSAFESAGVAGNSAGEAKTYKDNAKTYMDNAKNYSENVNVFTPSVSADGALSWTNKAGLENPTSVNIKGDKGDTGATGATGAKGDKGDKGDTGATGAAATIRIGTVTTGEPGSEASVTNSGTVSDAVFNFTIPRGNPGSGGGGSVDVDSELSSTSLNPVQNKVITQALDKKVNKDGIVLRAWGDNEGNTIATTYRKKSDSYSIADTQRLFECLVPYGTEITSNADLNTITYTKVGNYYCRSSDTTKTFTNCPVTKAFMMRVYSPISTVLDNESSDKYVYRLREIMTFTGETYRQYVSSSATAGTFTYNAWKQIAFTSNIPSVPTKVSAFTNDAGYLTEHQSLEGYAKMDAANTWEEQQDFKEVKLGYEKYLSRKISNTGSTPSISLMHYEATGAFTLDLSRLSTELQINESTVFTAYIASSADYPLTITNAGTIKYIGSASDVAITSAGLLLNILMMKDESDIVTSIVQASKLEGGA